VRRIVVIMCGGITRRCAKELIPGDAKLTPSISAVLLVRYTFMESTVSQAGGVDLVLRYVTDTPDIASESELEIWGRIQADAGVTSGNISGYLKLDLSRADELRRIILYRYG
jgi:hypothetical protein